MECTDIFLTRKFLYDKLNESGESKLEDQVIFLKKYLEKRTNSPKSKIPDLYKKISYFTFDLKKKWASSYRMKARFLTTNTDWLKTSIGMSTLHAWIRFFEWLLHVAYKLPLKKWQARGAEYKKNFETTKNEIKIKFKCQLGLIVDKPKPGYGNSNDGNTGRRFF